jgi:hypothetical protein
MPNRSRRSTIKRRNRKVKRNAISSKKYMRGGDFSTDDKRRLNDLGFSDSDISILEENGLNSVTLIQGELIRGNLTPQEIMQSLSEVSNPSEDNFDDFSQEPATRYPDESSHINYSNPSEDNFSQTPLSVDDLNDTDNTNDTQSTLTEKSEPTFSVGGKKHKRRTVSRKSRKGRKTRKSRKRSYKIKGGTTVYGNGYGSNCNEPNYNIYNTNLLKLFPYNPK